MWYFQFIGHDLIHVLSVRFHQRLFQPYPVNDGQYGINTIYGQQNKITEITCFNNQLPDKKYQYKSNRSGSHIARKTLRFFPEIEKIEYQQ